MATLVADQPSTIYKFIQECPDGQITTLTATYVEDGLRHGVAIRKTDASMDGEDLLVGPARLHKNGTITDTTGNTYTVKNVTATYDTLGTSSPPPETPPQVPAESS